jgi:hypothetical protein
MNQTQYTLMLTRIACELRYGHAILSRGYTTLWLCGSAGRYLPVTLLRIGNVHVHRPEGKVMLRCLWLR